MPTVFDTLCRAAPAGFLSRLLPYEGSRHSRNHTSCFIYINLAVGRDSASRARPVNPPHIQFLEQSLPTLIFTPFVVPFWVTSCVPACPRVWSLCMHDFVPVALRTRLTRTPAPLPRLRPSEHTAMSCISAGSILCVSVCGNTVRKPLLFGSGTSVPAPASLAGRTARPSPRLNFVL